MLCLVIVGFISLLGQTVLLRELDVAFYGIDLIYVLALAVWLLWSAAGSMLFRRRPVGRADTFLSRLFLGFAVCLIGAVAFLRGLRWLFSAVPGAYLPFSEQILSMALSLMPTGLLSGLLFQKAAARYVNARRSLAVAYGIESLGGLAGGLTATLALRLGIQNFALSLACSLAAVVAALLILRGGRWAVSPPAALAAALLLGLLSLSGSLDRAMTGWNHPLLVASHDSPYSRVTITKSAGQVTVFENDALSFETQGAASEELVHLAALQHPHPENVLLLGGGLEGGVREVLQHYPRRIDYVELNPVLLEMVRPWLPIDVRSSLSAPGVTVTTADPRRYLETAGQYDLILMAMPEPNSGRANRYYTDRFFARCASRLNPGGLLAFRLPASENLWTPQLSRRNAAIYRALKASFADVVVLPGSGNIYLASNRALARDPDLLASRFAERHIRSRVVSAPYLRYLYRNDRFRQISRALEAPGAAVNTDRQPVCYQYTVVMWLSKFFPRLAVADLEDSWPVYLLKPRMLWLPGMLLLALFGWGVRRPFPRGVLLAAMAGFTGMVLETLLILHYQIASGVLFQDIGLLLMSFMAGLALGSLAAGRRAGSQPRSGAASCLWGSMMLAGFAAVSLWTGVRVRSGTLGGVVETALLLAAAGFLVAGVFAFASLQIPGERHRAIAPLYGADLLGGCLGSLSGSLLLIPFAGLDLSAFLMAPLSVLALTLTMRGWAGQRDS